MLVLGRDPRDALHRLELPRDWPALLFRYSVECTRLCGDIVVEMRVDQLEIGFVAQELDDAFSNRVINGRLTRRACEHAPVIKLREHIDLTPKRIERLPHLLLLVHTHNAQVE